ncbi:MAG: EAL domain-containing protein [Pseudomonadota bacterium]
MFSDAQVLVVDDIRSNRHYLIKHLEKQGIRHVFEAENGREALDILSRQHIDLVLLDVMMPEIDGYEVLRQMKSQETLRDIPVIMITAVNDMESTVTCIENGAEDYLPKPFNPILLRARVSACLEKKRLRDVEREYLRHYDAGTGLPNPTLFLNRLTDEIGRWQYHHHLFGLLFIRMGRHRMLVESLGQKEAEAYTIKQAARLQALLSPGALLARLGQNEFGILLYHANHPAEATALAGHLLEALNRPIVIGGHDITGRIHMGIAFSSSGYRHAQEMVRDAGLAANTADPVSGYQIFDRKMHQNAMRRLTLEPELQKAVEDNQLRLYYQPIVNTANGRVVAFEGLVRWQHPERGMIPPDDFISLAEETGLIIPIGKWVLEEGCRQLRRWRDDFPKRTDLMLSINVSASQFKDDAFVSVLEEALSSTGVSGRHLKLELTETEIIDNPNQVENVLEQIHRLGISAVLDDFGTGYCSLSYLHRFPFQVLKIDQSFVRGIDRENKNQSIVESTLLLAHRLGMEVIAEGIETQEELAVLKRLNCELGQGALYHLPMPAASAERHLAEEFLSQVKQNPVTAS